MCETLRCAARDCNQNAISISFVSPNDGTLNRNLDEFDSSFMYTQVMKEILLTIDFEQHYIDEFLIYCREQFADNTVQLRYVDRLEKEYHCHTPIWWYTIESFLYEMLNEALHHMDVDIIIKLGFFIRDLHQHIAQLHSEQYSSCDPSLSFIVYRGQGFSQTEFEQLRSKQGRLLSFNNFLSTSENRDVSFNFALQAIADPDLIGILFVIRIDPSIVSTPFANVKSVSYFQFEEEILFSMHSIFRIGQIQQIDENNHRLWQVDLTMTSDTDPQLQALTEYIRKESFPNQNGWYRLGSLMIKLGQYNKAQEGFENILKRLCNVSEKANIYHMLGVVKYSNGEYTEAITSYEKSIEMMQIYPTTHPQDLAASYKNLATVYDKIGEYSKALSYHEKALEVYQDDILFNHSTFSVSYDNSNSTDETMDDCVKAILLLGKTFKILQQILPADDPSLAAFYDRYGSVYEKMGDNSKALFYYERALKIKEKHLPSNHPSLATSYANHAAVYENMGDSSTAQALYQRALDIRQTPLPANHPELRRYCHHAENNN